MARMEGTSSYKEEKAVFPLHRAELQTSLLRKGILGCVQQGKWDGEAAVRGAGPHSSVSAQSRPQDQFFLSKANIP